jgi:hypothetical protein
MKKKPVGFLETIQIHSHFLIFEYGNRIPEFCSSCDTVSVLHTPHRSVLYVKSTVRCITQMAERLE